MNIEPRFRLREIPFLRSKYKILIHNQAATPNTLAIMAPTSTGPRAAAAAVRVAEADAETLPVRDMEDVPKELELRETEVLIGAVRLRVRNSVMVHSQR
jgi:hypothetical protein